MIPTYPFPVKPLPYPFDALEPFIDTKTMKLHHNRHYKTYVDNLNAVLKKHPEYQHTSLEELLLNVFTLPPDLQTEIMNNGGGVYNHELYFDLLSPVRKNSDGSYNEVQKMLARRHGSFPQFEKTFKDAALKQFGSGYAWLVLTPEEKLCILTSSNQFTPLSYGFFPLMLADVWEHAYYLKHYNKRGDYIDDWFDVLNWDKVNERYLSMRQRADSSSFPFLS